MRRRVFDAWRVGLEKRLRAPDIVPACGESYLAKHRSLAPSIALICHLIGGGAAAGSEASPGSDG